MIEQARRIALVLVFVAAAVSAWPANAEAAAIQVAITSADTSSSARLEVYGTATCGQPSGQGTVSVTAVQVMDFVFGAGSTTITCAAGPVAWHITVYGSPSWHGGAATVNAIFTDGVGITSDSGSFYL